jgi:quercetin dioxygenase-like cupin family protein
MNRSKFVAVTVAFVFVTCVLALHAQETRAKRDVLIKQDISGFPGHEGVVVHVEFVPGAREPRHIHPGDIFGYIQEGTLTVGIEDQQAVTFKPGEVFFVPAGKVHWGENAGTTPVKVLATFVVEKGKALTTAVQ